VSGKFAEAEQLAEEISPQAARENKQFKNRVKKCLF
jgi:hypothetical protein